MIPGGNMSYTAAAYQQMLSLAGYTAAQQAALSANATRSPFQPSFPGTAAGFGGGSGAGYQVKPGSSVPQRADVKLKKLPFYDIHAELLPPTSLLAQGSSRFQEAQFQFQLTLQQASEIASTRDIRMGSKLDYQHQIQLRFCPLDSSAEQGDEFPPSICVTVNSKMCQLPNPIPTNKPNVEPKRPPKPISITPYCKLSPMNPNVVNIKWASEFSKGWVVGIWLVEKLTSEQLLDRLKMKGSRNPDFTRDLIKEKLNDDEDGIATTNLKVTVACPLGKMRMTIPCRPTTCDHLQCFDAMLFLQMNERKPTWQCPVCDKPALYDNLMVDGYFLEVIKDPVLPTEENEIILNQDGSWHPVPKEEEEAKKKKEEKKEEDKEEVDLVDLSDDDGEGGSKKASAATASDDDGAAPKTTETAATAANSDDEGESGAPAAVAAPASNGTPGPTGEIECIDLE